MLEAIETPFYVDGKIMLPPTFTWGSRVANAPPNLSYPGFLNLNRTHNITVSGTKLSGNHTFKAGFYYFTAYKAENLGVGIIAPANGALNFPNDTNNPFDSGFGYANAAIGTSRSTSSSRSSSRARTSTRTSSGSSRTTGR